MKAIYKEILALLEDQESFVVATILGKSGSTPRSSGAKMVVKKDGSTIGTIGGGQLEADVIQLAQQLFVSRQSIIWPFDLTSEAAADTNMICGGHGEILLDYILSDLTNHEFYIEVNKTLENGEKAWLVTRLEGIQFNQARQQCLVRPNGNIVGNVDINMISPDIIIGLFKKPTIVQSGTFNRFFIEPVHGAGTVYIFGGGHIAQKLAPLADSVGFKTVVLDDRAEYISRLRFNSSTELVQLESFEKLSKIVIDDESYLVIVTRGHLHDQTVLEWALATNAVYIGMIGSRRKRDMCFTALLAQGFSQEDLKKVYSPIGLEIGAETPEEIAVSIVGQLIKVRKERADGKS